LKWKNLKIFILEIWNEKIWNFSFWTFNWRFPFENWIFFWPYHPREMKKIEMNKSYISFISPR
jgi:hypothetical protein